MKIEIRNRYTYEVIFTYDCEDNTIKKTVEEAVRKHVSLSCSNMSGSNMSGSDMSGSDMSGIKTSGTTAFFSLCCPPEGSFIAFKKANNKIVKLLITEDAKRSSATSLRCRASKAKVLSIESIDKTETFKSVKSNYNSNFIYKVGETVEVTDFDENRWTECSTGIHFFISRMNAEQ